MATNNRMWYAVKAIGMAARGSLSFTAIHGLQSFGMDTAFNIERILQLGQSAIYENKEESPDITVNMTKVLDGYPTPYMHATQQATTPTLTGRSSAQCGLAMSIFEDTYNSASGIPQRQVMLSGLFPNSVSYNFNVDSNSTEEISLIGTQKEWLSGGSINFTGNIFTNNDSPNAITGSGGVQRRQHVVFGTTSDTLLPPDVAGISSSGTNDQVAGVFSASVQTINISADLNRTGLRELGRKGYYHRFVGFPVEVQTQIEIIAKSGDGVNCFSETDNLSNRTIKVKTLDGLVVNCGSLNKLTGITFGGGDTGGGFDSIQYSYTNANDMTVQAPYDVNTALRN